MLPDVHVKILSELWTAITLYLIDFVLPPSPCISVGNWKTEGSIKKHYMLYKALFELHIDINNTIFNICTGWSLFLEQVTFILMHTINCIKKQTFCQLHYLQLSFKYNYGVCWYCKKIKVRLWVIVWKVS